MGSRPPCDLSEIPGIVLKWYGLNVTVVKEMESYDDRNVLVELVNDVGNEYCPQEKFVVKFLNEIASTKPETSNLQNAMILHLKQAGFPTPAPLVNVHGQHQAQIALGADTKEKYILRMMEFVPGTTLNRIPLTATLCEELGEMGGRVDVALKDFPVEEHPCVDDMKVYWNLTEIPYLKNRMHYVKEEDRLSLIKQLISDFETRVLQDQSTFSKGLIHADMNDCNIIVTPSQQSDPSNSIGNQSIEHHTTIPGTNNYTISSLIDFGDSTCSLYLFELTVAITYVMVNTSNLDPMVAAASVLSGYLKHMALTQHELLHLRLCICVRMVQTYVLGMEAKYLDGSNEYSQTHCDRVWPAMLKLSKLTDEEFLNQLRK